VRLSKRRIVATDEHRRDQEPGGRKQRHRAQDDTPADHSHPCKARLPDRHCLCLGHGGDDPTRPYQTRESSLRSRYERSLDVSRPELEATATEVTPRLGQQETKERCELLVGAAGARPDRYRCDREPRPFH
jgi:hypothetical protein